MFDIENVMRYFSVNQVDKERYYKGAYIQRKKILKEKDTMKKVLTTQKKEAQIKNGTHQVM